MRGFGGYAELFQAATGFAPYPSREDLANQPDLPSLVSVPTGCGKRAASDGEGDAAKATTTGSVQIWKQSLGISRSYASEGTRYLLNWKGVPGILTRGRSGNRTVEYQGVSARKVPGTFRGVSA